MCKVLKNVLLPKYVTFPNEKEWLKIADGFDRKCNFPNCLGALNGIHIKIQKPNKSGAKFKNFKKCDSIVLMAI